MTLTAGEPTRSTRLAIELASLELAPADREAVDGLAAALGRAVPDGRLGVAFSGGVDSATLLALAVRALGRDRVLAVLGVSPSLAADERTAAHDVAAGIGVPLVEVLTHEGDNPEYRRNGPDRCFFCKQELFLRIDAELVAAHGLTAVAYGENADDARRPDRPGSRAATDHAVLRPLADAGLDKAAVRRIARALDLPVADKPAAPCLASRIPHFHEVTPEKLAQVDAAEAALRRLGLGDLRVRHHDDVARLEVPPDQLVDLVTPPCATTSWAPCGRQGSASWRSTSPASSPAPSPCRW
ncbi:ATP-dependent sacrificial sulfur transferase LarE [Cellulomonas sp. ATA003]|uniref:ATP-dependent sacrificial sulfur transferase LarE n=1 Tax=Cellulomonas sp. ATA003 TaxID=3073064 RepID=UPI002873172E|nr:ATP-dependent sacrificial sulfur transferase LarE [Cellulomonas sp. ATA003]WNB87225.1 ATP-dependent sacrificial sulfur transferase LarE [Cellulomonas sp. ATA003]